MSAFGMVMIAGIHALLIMQNIGKRKDKRIESMIQK